ncbi:MAG: hypothetical protein HRT45_05660 [Bdellovibrionales bacterium]|nr:hypothetical protein [Bdellovibrionales bacterium]
MKYQKGSAIVDWSGCKCGQIKLKIDFTRMNSYEEKINTLLHMSEVIQLIHDHYLKTTKTERKRAFLKVVK